MNFLNLYVSLDDYLRHMKSFINQVLDSLEKKEIISLCAGLVLVVLLNPANIYWKSF